MQEGHVIFYELRNLMERERNYATHYFELGSIVHALTMWTHYFLGCEFELRTDHKSLKYLFDQPGLNARQSRLLIFLNKFDFEIKHVKGKETKLSMLWA